MTGKTSGISITAVIDSYRDAPSSLKMRAEEMAAAGFIYGGSGDFKAKCQSCSIVLNCNNVKTDPWEVHIRDSPTCTYVKVIRKYILKSTSTGERKHDRCLTEALSSAITSFDKAPPLLKDRAARFSMAGFVFTGESNKIECQCCGIYNSNINRIVEDDPVVWHGRAVTKCAHQELLKKYSLIDAAGSQDLQAKIESYETSPPSLKERALTYVMAGFFYAGIPNEVLVHCRSCNLFVNIKEPCLSPWKNHKSSRPDCEYVLFVEKNGISEIMIAQNLMTNIVSFENAPPVIKKMARRFALAGFKYTGMGDRVTCSTCNMTSHNYTSGNDPWRAHRTSNPSCKYVQFLEKYEIVDITNQDLATKLTSFDTAPISLKNRSGEVALAGFEYTGFGDRIKCFTCGLILIKISENFDPFSAHLRHQPVCSYMQLLQNYGIIKIVRELAERTIKIVQEPPEKTPTLKVVHQPEEPTAPPMHGEICSGDRNSDRQTIDSLCSICMNRSRDIALVPCGHMSTCSACVSNMSDCPICRKAIERTLKIFS